VCGRTQQGLDAWQGYCQLNLMKRITRKGAKFSRLFCTVKPVFQVDSGAPTTCSQAANLCFIRALYTPAVQRCRATRKCEVMIPKAERKRCAWPAYLNLLITRSRNLVG
jgi:hypothetical protein